MDNCDYYVQYVLPATFDDSLSYYEVIAKLTTAMRSLVDDVNATLKDFDSKSKEYTDEQIKLATVNINNQIIKLNEQYSQFVRLINNNIEVLNQDFEKTKRDLKDMIVSVNARTDLVIEENNEYLLEVIGSQLLDIKVVNYFTGELVSVQEMFDYLSRFHLNNAISYDQLRNRNKTVNQFIAYGMNYTDLATNGGSIIK